MVALQGKPDYLVVGFEGKDGQSSVITVGDVLDYFVNGCVKAAEISRFNFGFLESPREVVPKLLATLTIGLSNVIGFGRVCFC